MDCFTGENQASSSANLAMYDAAIKGDVKKLKRALDEGANPNFYNEKGDGVPCALHVSVGDLTSDEKRKGGGLLCAKVLIENGARTDTTLISNKNTPLHEGKTWLEMHNMQLLFKIEL